MKRQTILTCIFAFIAMHTFAQVPNDTTQAKRRRPTFRFDAHNPDMHDPVMAREGNTYYIFATGMGINVLSSTDLQTWQMERPAWQQAPQWATDSVPGYRGHTWAPDIQRVGDRWLLYYSCSTFGKNQSAIGLATNKTLDPKSPDYHWDDQGVVIRSRRNIDPWNAIDPNLIIDEKGQPWLTFGSFWDGIQLVPLSKDDFKTPVGDVRTIARKWNPEAMKEEGVEANNNEIEAPFIVRHGKYYYLFASTGLCCRGLRSTYRTVVGRSRHIEGPYKARDGKQMLKGGGTLVAGGNEQYAGIGHCAVYHFDDEWYFVAHGYDKSLNGASKLVLKKLQWKDGWPVLAE